MTMKQNLVKDMLCVIAHGTSTARASAAKLLFYYWPTFNSSLFERKGIPPKFTSNLFIFIYVYSTKNVSLQNLFFCAY